jgi:hypothetical protein
VAYYRELFGSGVVDYVPICLSDNKAVDPGPMQELLEIITAEVSHGQAVALVRAYYDQFQKGRFEKVVDQLANLVKSTIRKK